MEYLIHYSDGSERYLSHYGIKGMKWGVWNEETKARRSGKGKDTGLNNIKNARNSNLDKWGKTPDTNVLYITGYSGSGKSTAASSVARKNDHVIHLDAYFEKDHKDTVNNTQDKEFNKHLDKSCPLWKHIPYASSDKDAVLTRNSQVYWKTLEQFSDAVDSFGKKQFSKGNRVIAEGVQIADGALKARPEDYKGKPISILSTGPVKSLSRAFNRDNKGNVLQGLNSVDSAKEYILWYADSYKNLNMLSNTTHAKKGKKYLDRILYS